MDKYRVWEQGGSYYIQRRRLWWWFFLTEQGIDGVPVEVSFADKAAALRYATNANDRGRPLTFAPFTPDE